MLVNIPYQSCFVRRSYIIPNIYADRGRKDGYTVGYKQGSQKGYEAGYEAAIREGRAA